MSTYSSCRWINWNLKKIHSFSWSCSSPFTIHLTQRRWQRRQQGSAAVFVGLIRRQAMSRTDVERGRDVSGHVVPNEMVVLVVATMNYGSISQPNNSEFNLQLHISTKQQWVQFSQDIEKLSTSLNPHGLVTTNPHGVLLKPSATNWGHHPTETPPDVPVATFTPLPNSMVVSGDPGSMLWGMQTFQNPMSTWGGFHGSIVRHPKIDGLYGLWKIPGGWWLRWPRKATDPQKRRRPKTHVQKIGEVH